MQHSLTRGPTALLGAAAARAPCRHRGVPSTRLGPLRRHPTQAQQQSRHAAKACRPHAGQEPQSSGCAPVSGPSPPPRSAAHPGASAGALAALALLAPALAPAAALAAAAADASGGACVDGEELNTLIVIACIVEFIGLTGAAVGGYVARVRKQEVEKINAQLRQININLRKQARVESYAPSLSYAPVGSPAAAAAASEVAVKPAATAVADAAPPVDAREEEVLRLLRAGKQSLRVQDPAQAEVHFKRALALAQKLDDTVEVKKAARGVGASLQRQGKYEEAIGYHKMVLSRSKAANETSGDTEAYGAIADCYTELGDLENAAKFYDRYINRLEDD